MLCSDASGGAQATGPDGHIQVGTIRRCSGNQGGGYTEPVHRVRPDTRAQYAHGVLHLHSVCKAQRGLQNPHRQGTDWSGIVCARGLRGVRGLRAHPPHRRGQDAADDAGCKQPYALQGGGGLRRAHARGGGLQGLLQGVGTEDHLRGPVCRRAVLRAHRRVQGYPTTRPSARVQQAQKLILPSHRLAHSHSESLSTSSKIGVPGAAAQRKSMCRDYGHW
mmetsp:Transcript_21852/g.42441  ORF Transcript_21852/g.42441 Transcript_21852/m.42441 type:complete len:220 (-) Transcript_21852:87-746(-)